MDGKEQKKETERELGALWAPCNNQPEPLRETNVKPQSQGQEAERQRKRNTGELWLD